MFTLITAFDITAVMGQIISGKQAFRDSPCKTKLNISVGLYMQKDKKLIEWIEEMYYWPGAKRFGSKILSCAIHISDVWLLHSVVLLMNTIFTQRQPSSTETWLVWKQTSMLILCPRCFKVSYQFNYTWLPCTQHFVSHTCSFHTNVL